MNPPITLLLVEDSPADARFVREMLKDAATARFDVVHVERLGEAINRVGDGDIQVILLDLSLPDAQGIETLALLHNTAPRLPIVVMSGVDDESVAMQGLREGAQDYLVKGRVESDLLVRSLRYAIERQHTEDRLSAKTREQEHFIYTVSHDLRAPLVSLQGMASILIEDYGATLDADARMYIDRIVANAQKMQTLLNDLLEISRVGRVDMELDSIDLHDVVCSVSEQLQHTLSARGATLQIEGRLPRVYANRTRMTQVFTNLIDNAVAYTPPARAPLVLIGAAARPDGWELRVQDNGVGIPRSFQHKVFDIFQRLPTGKALNPSGSGVGLAIVSRIVESHGGRLWIESMEGVGTTIHFTLPHQATSELGGSQHTLT